MINIKKSIGLLLPAMRISFALVLLTSCILLTAEMLGFTPQENKFLFDTRTKISESLAIQMSLLIPDQDIKKIQKLLRYIVKRNPDILSAGIRLSSGKLIFQSVNHTELWGNYQEEISTASHVLVPISQHGKFWGNIELRFEQLKGESLLSFFQQPIFKLIAFISLFGFFIYLVFILKTLRQLDPTAVIPERVQAAFNTLAECVIIIDENEQILLANKSFSEKTGLDDKTLTGIKASELNWKNISTQKSGTDFPWKKVLNNGKSIIGAQLIYKKSTNDFIKFAINSSPILGEKDKAQGVLITLDDISVLEQHNTELKDVVTRLHKSQFQIKQQNKELTFLATRDPLTGCLNRRSFNEQFEILFNQAKQLNTELSCMMVDIDHFKLVNDNYGHAVGDVVIQLLAEVLKSNSRKDDLVARYGGEEFCLVLPGTTVDVALSIAERIRIRSKSATAERFEIGPRITVSLGVSCIHNNPKDPGDLNNMADQALYIAKESGRNQVVRWEAEAEAEAKAEAKAEAAVPVLMPVAAEAEINESTEQQGIVESSETHEHVEQLQNRIGELEEMTSKFSAQIEYQQNYDALTDLPNQILFYDRTQQAIEHGYRLDQLAAVLIIDLDNFSQINTTLGRSVGDQLLHEFAERLKHLFRKSDAISRFSGDEFAVLLTDISQQEQVSWAVKRLISLTEQSVEIEGNTIHVSVQVGISIYPTDANTVDKLLNHAIIAKKYCKNHDGHTNYQFYDQNMQKMCTTHLRLEKELHAAIRHQEWQLLYQPKLDINNNKIIGAEALIRWQHPQRGLLSPYEFIDFAEQRNLIIPIGDWVIQQACKQLKDFISQGITDCAIAINISSKQLVQPDLVQKIFSALEQYDIPSRLFSIEVTETALINNLDVALSSLKRISSRGIKIAIDDFGTGYSSLNYLKNMPIDLLKIDRSFIIDVCHDDNDKQIVKALISMAHSLNINVIAEGVEEKEQLDLLNKYNCDEIQGYILSKPVTADEFEHIIKNPQQYTVKLK